MSASRVETESKTAAPRWETEGDDYKADLSKYPEEIKDLCPIVITTCDCRPTKFKDADEKELSLKDKAGKLLELKDIGVEEVKKSSAEGRNEFKKDGKRVEAMDFEFDKNIKGDENNDDAHFLVDVSVDKKEGRSYNIFEGRDIVYRESNDLNKQVEGFVNRRTGHGYQAVDGALDYYLAEL